MIATGVAADWHCEVLRFAVGDSEDGAFWTAFLRTLKARGLAGSRWSAGRPSSAQRRAPLAGRPLLPLTRCAAVGEW